MKKKEAGEKVEVAREKDGEKTRRRTKSQG